MISYLTLNEAEELDRFVIHHPRGHYMQTSRYGRSRPDYGWLAIVLRNASGKICASIALLLRTVRFTGKQLCYAPRGPVFTTLAEFREIMEAAQALCRTRGGYLLRIDPPVPVEDAPFREQARKLGFHISLRDDYSTFQPKNVYQTQLDGLNQETLLRRFHPKTRYNIRLAQRRGVSIRRGDLSDVPVFCDMMRQTALRDGFSARAEAFFTRFLIGMGTDAQLFLAQRDGQILAGAIEVMQGEKAWYAYGCSQSCGRENMANHLLQWVMLCAAMEQGCRVYDFRGVEGRPVLDNPAFGQHRFKQGFDACFVEYAGQMDLELRPNWCRVIRFVQKHLL